MGNYALRDELLAGFEYPPLFFDLVEHDLLDFDLWFVMESELAEKVMQGLQKRYPGRALIPFAKREDNDDVACFEHKKGERVQIIHDYSSPGYEQRGEFESLGHWLKQAINEFVLFHSDESKAEVNAIWIM